MRKPIICFLVALSILLCSCIDTCFPGDNFSKVKLVNGLEKVNGSKQPQYMLRLNWENRPVGFLRERLPEKYFKAVKTGSEWIEKIELSGPTEYTIYLSEAFNQFLENKAKGTDKTPAKTIGFRLEFPDRNWIITCMHSCTQDFYFLTISFTLDDNLQPRNFKFKNDVIKGYC